MRTLLAGGYLGKYDTIAEHTMSCQRCANGAPTVLGRGVLLRVSTLSSGNMKWALPADTAAEGVHGTLSSTEDMLVTVTF
jgi:hypothetical protein